MVDEQEEARQAESLGSESKRNVVLRRGISNCVRILNYIAMGSAAKLFLDWLLKRW